MIDNKPAREATAVGQLAEQQATTAAIVGIGQDRTPVVTTNFAAAGDKVLIGTIALLAGSGTPWFDRSPFFSCMSDGVALEIQVDHNATDGDVASIDVDFCLCMAITGQAGDTYPLNGGDFRFSDRWRANDAGLSADVRQRFVQYLAVPPGALLRLGAKFLPGSTNATSAPISVYASGVIID